MDHCNTNARCVKRLPACLPGLLNEMAATEICMKGKALVFTRQITLSIIDCVIGVVAYLRPVPVRFAWDLCSPGCLCKY